MTAARGGKGRVGRGLNEAAEALLGMGVEQEEEDLQAQVCRLQSWHSLKGDVRGRRAQRRPGGAGSRQESEYRGLWAGGYFVLGRVRKQTGHGKLRWDAKAGRVHHGWIAWMD